MRVLVAEDDQKISEILCHAFRAEGMELTTASDGLSALKLASQRAFDLMVLDLMLPNLDGMSIIEQLRAQGVQTKILILSAKRSVDERVKGLQGGADDYLTKPFAITELIARCHALLRRNKVEVNSPQLVRGDIAMDFIKREVRREGKLIRLRAKEFSLLEIFLRNPGKTITKEQILNEVWNLKFDPGTNVVDVLVYRLRTKLDKDFDHKSIRTLRGIGYVFNPDKAPF